MAFLVKFLFFSLVSCATGWVIFVFAAKLLIWILSRKMGVSIVFDVAGCNCLRDVTVKLRKGAVESVSIGEVKFCLNLGFAVISQGPKLQLLLCDLEIVIRPSEKRIKSSKIKKSSYSRSPSISRKMWASLTSITRFLSVAVTDLVVKVPNTAIEVKELKLDVSKNGDPDPILSVKLHITPFVIQIFDSKINIDRPSNCIGGGSMLNSQPCSAVKEKDYGLICESFIVSFEFGHGREQEIKVQRLNITSGEVTVNLNESMLGKTKSKSVTSISTEASEKVAMDPIEAKSSLKDKTSDQSLKKHICMLPEKVSFDMPKLNLNYIQSSHDLALENSVVGIHLQASKSEAYESSGETASHVDIQIGLREINLLRQGATSLLEILKFVFTTSIVVPMQPPLPIRTEIDLKIGATRCNLTISRLKPLLLLQLSKKKGMALQDEKRIQERSQPSKIKSKGMVLQDEKQIQERSQPSKIKSIMWTCTVSASDITIVIYSINELPLYYGCSQCCHLFANNIASKGIQVHADLGELHVRLADDDQCRIKENLYCLDINSGSLLHVQRVSLDWGHREMQSHEEHDPNRWKLVLSVSITGLEVCFGFYDLECLVTTILSFKELVPASSKRATPSKMGRSSKSSGKGTRILNIDLDKCSINYCGDMSLEDMVVPDPKRVNFGSQGGRVTISASADGTPRTASIKSVVSSDSKNLKFSTSLHIINLNVCMNKEKNSMKIELERAKSVHREYSEENKPREHLTLFDMQKTKFVRRSGVHNDGPVCSLFNATDIALRWEPDVHLAILELVTRLKAVLHSRKNQVSDVEIKDENFLKDPVAEKEASPDQVHVEKQHKKKDSVFAIDVELLKVSAELADGVEAMVQVQSIFSENAKIGVLLEGLMLSFNEIRVFKNSRMQISRIPVSVSSNLIDAEVQNTTTWDWVIQGSDIHVCMPYRLQLRAIDDAVEDTLRALKLIINAKTNLIFPMKKDMPKKSKAESKKFGSIRFMVHKLRIDIEEEPLQGWLDKHYRLLKNEASELAVRLKIFDEIFSEASRVSPNESNELGSERKIQYNGLEIDVRDGAAIQRLRDEIHKQTFRSYYQACQRIMISEGSGACKNSFQAGFKPSENRDAVLSLCATELDATLTAIKGGDNGMIEFINKVDPVSLENEIPFSRLYGSDFVLSTGSLVAQLRDYTFPLFAGTCGSCQGQIVLAQQATSFQPQMHQDVYVGRWWKVQLLRSATGTTPPTKFYSNLPIFFQKGEVSFGVGYEPVFADISYAFTVALRRANLGIRSTLDPLQTAGANLALSQPPKRERSLPWWDDMRNYIHGKIGLCFTETKWNVLATTDPYEKLDKLHITSGYMDIQQTDGRVCLSSKEFKAFPSSLESLVKNFTVNSPSHEAGPFIGSPAFSLEILIDWECESGTPLNHYLFSVPKEGEPRKKVFDPFRSTSLSLRWSFSLRSCLHSSGQCDPSGSIDHEKSSEGLTSSSPQKLKMSSMDSPTVNLGAHDMLWLVKFWNMMNLPPQKIRFFSRWPRYGVARIARSGNLSLDRVMTEFFLRIDSTPTCVRHMPLCNDDPADGLTIKATKLKLELCFSRGKQLFTFDCKREPLDLVYDCLDLHLLKVYLSRESKSSLNIRKTKRSSESVQTDKFANEKFSYMDGRTKKPQDDGFLVHSDYFTMRKQTPKADASRLSEWQEAGRKDLEMTTVRSEYENGSDNQHTRSDPSDDDGFNVVVADNCRRIFVYGLKLLWTIENRDAVLSFVGGMSKAFEPPKVSPSRQYAQRKLFEEKDSLNSSENPDCDAMKSPSSMLHGGNSLSPQHDETLVSLPSASPTRDCSSTAAFANIGRGDDSEEEGTHNFMVNVIQPQLNLHSEEANGRFLLAAASGRILSRSFHSVLHVGNSMIERAQSRATGSEPIPGTQPELTWNRGELSVMLEHVQAHVAPTDVDPGAGVQWLPKILRSSPKVKRTGALLERVFMPCQMYFRHTRHKGGTPELKVKPLKELAFNSPNITATMTSRQFQVMMDVLTNLLFARLPKTRKTSIVYPYDDDDDDDDDGEYTEEAADSVVPDGLKEVELAKINLERRERERKLLLDDIRIISDSDMCGDLSVPLENKDDLWMISGGKANLVQYLLKELKNLRILRKEASSSLRMALQKASQFRLMEKEKNKSASCAMRISVRINKVGWSMLSDGKPFAEAEINDMVYDFDRDYRDIGIAQFTTKFLIIKNCLSNAKSDVLLSAWNAPSEWGKNVMLRMNAKQAAPKNGKSSLEFFQVEIYPLKIHLTETMYRMIWGYLFPGEEQDPNRRQEAWKVSTTSGSRRLKKGLSGPESTSSSSHVTRESDGSGKLAATAFSITPGTSTHGDYSQVSKLQNVKANSAWCSTPELRRTSSFDRTWEENLAESVANELVSHVHSPTISSKGGSQQAISEAISKNKSKDSKAIKSNRSSLEEKVIKSNDEKKASSGKIIEFHNIKISQVELLLTYEGSPLSFSDLRLLMDTFHRDDFTGTWNGLIVRVRKHVIWGVLKSLTGMQGKKFKAKSHNRREPQPVIIPENLDLSDSDGPENADQFPLSWPKRPSEGAGDGFVTSVRGLFNSQRRRAKKFVLRTMRGEADNELQGEWSESDAEFTPFARQLTITKAKKLIRRHTKKYRPTAQKKSGTALQQGSQPTSPREMSPIQSDNSDAPSSEELNDQISLH